MEGLPICGNQDIFGRFGGAEDGFPGVYDGRIVPVMVSEYDPPVVPGSAVMALIAIHTFAYGNMRTTKVRLLASKVK